MRTTNRQCLRTALMAAAFLALNVQASDTGAAPLPASPPPAEEIQGPPPSLLGILRSLSKFLGQEDINLLYEYLRDSIIASITKQEEEVLMPPDLAFKMEIIKKRAEIEGNHYVNTVVMPEVMRLAPSLFTKPPATTAAAEPAQTPKK